jgi:hypothetical protein
LTCAYLSPLPLRGFKHSSKFSTHIKPREPAEKVAIELSF